MGWITIYMTGNEDFRESVREKLYASDLKIMPGYLGGSASESVSDMYWIDSEVSLRQVKEAIGSRLIWKYRLKLYASLEDFIQSQSPKSRAAEFTQEENALLAEMQASVYRTAS